MRRVGPNLITPRCPECGIHLARCLCPDLVALPTRTKIVFVQHVQELQKPTNSARLALKVLADARIVAWERTSPPAFVPDPILLYPLEGAEVLAPEELTESVTVLVPDGTWGQASKIANAMGRGRVRARILPEGNRSLWTVRNVADVERISSAQAAAAVLAIAGETAAARGLLEALTEANRRILSMRGIVPGPAEPKVLPPRPW